MNLGSMLLGLFLAFAVKIAVMGLSARLLLRAYGVPRRDSAWRLIPGDSAGARLIRASLWLFALSELVCGVEVYILLRSTLALGVAHALASALGMAAFALGVLDHTDATVVRWGTPRCVLNRWCQGCTVSAPEGCRMRPVALTGATALGFGALPPLLASTAQLDARPERLLLPFPAVNTWFDTVFAPWLAARVPAYDPGASAWSFWTEIQILEFRLVPLASLALIAAGIAAIRAGREAAGARVAAVGAGMLAYAWFELACYRVTGDLLLGSLVHEVAELWFLVFTGELAVRMFPQSGSHAPSHT